MLEECDSLAMLGKLLGKLVADYLIPWEFPLIKLQSFLLVMEQTLVS